MERRKAFSCNTMLHVSYTKALISSSRDVFLLLELFVTRNSRGPAAKNRIHLA